jgi:energy-coupling factor transport system permease protein
LRYLTDLTLGRYFDLDSILHQLDPRIKLICTLLLMIAVFLIFDAVGMVVFSLLMIVLYFLGKIPLHVFWGNLRAFLWLYLITFSIHLFLHPGRELISIPYIGWEISIEGIEAGVLFTLRIAVLVSLSSLLMAVTTPQDLTDGLERLLKPLRFFKVPVSEGALMVSITIRFVPILMQEAVKIRQAQLARGADLEGSWIVRIRKSLPMILPLFSGALKKADVLAVAMEARGYRGGSNRTRMIALKFHITDWLALTLTLALASLVLYIY